MSASHSLSGTSEIRNHDNKASGRPHFRHGGEMSSARLVRLSSNTESCVSSPMALSLYRRIQVLVISAYCAGFLLPPGLLFEGRRFCVCDSHVGARATRRSALRRPGPATKGPQAADEMWQVWLGLVVTASVTSEQDLPDFAAPPSAPLAVQPSLEARVRRVGRGFVQRCFSFTLHRLPNTCAPICLWWLAGLPSTSGDP